MSSNSEIASKQQAVVDVSVLPKNVPSLCIPRMFPNITKERILQVFGDLDICDIDHIDMIPKTSTTGEKFQRVFIHMSQWKNNPQAVRARARVLEGKEIKIIYDDPWFWKVSANRSSPNQNAVVVPNNRNSTQKARVFMDLDCDNNVNTNTNNINNKPPRNNNNTNNNKYNNKNMNAPNTNSNTNNTSRNPNPHTNNQNRGKYTKILTKPTATATANATVATATAATATAATATATADTVATPILTLSVPTVDTTTVFEPSSPTSPPPSVAVKTEIDNIVLVKRRARVVTKVKEEKEEEGEVDVTK